MVSIVICHHRGKLIHKAVETLKKSKRVKFEIIVMSSMPDLEIDGARVVHQDGPPAIKRNLSVRFVKYPHIAFFDDDVEVRDNTVYEMLKVLKHKPRGMVFGKLLNYEFQNMFDEAGGFMTPTGFIWARGDRRRDVGQFEVAEPIFAGKSAACMIKKKTFTAVGMFDISMGILGEESDLAWRVWRAGQQVYYAPKSVTYHKFNTRFKPREVHYTEERIFYNGPKNYLLMLFKNAHSSLLVTAIPCQTIAWLLTALGHLSHGRLKAATLIFRGIYRGYFQGINRRVFQDKKPVHKLPEILMYNPGVSYFFNRFFSYIKTGLHG